MLFWASLSQWVMILGIILAAFIFPEPRYIDYMRGGDWTPQKSASAANNSLIYMRRFIRRGAGAGLALGLVAGLLTWIVG